MPAVWSRRQILQFLASSGVTCALGIPARQTKAETSVDGPPDQRALISITLDLEMSRNFPTWETTHWDYEKGNLDTDTKQYALDAGRRVRERGGMIHYFCVGRVLEQEDISWLTTLAEEGHPIGNHTYDHVNVLAVKPENTQFRFQRAPWLVEGMTAEDIIRHNIHLTTLALKQRAGITNSGFRTPGGFNTGLQGREDIQKMLLESGFSWVSSKYPAHANSKQGEAPSQEVYDSIVKAVADAQPFTYPTGLVEVPMSPISDIGAFRGGRWPLAAFLKAIQLAIEWTIEHRAVFDFLAHPSCLVAADPQFKAIDLICDLVEKAGERAALCDLNTLARRAPRTP